MKSAVRPVLQKEKKQAIFQSQVLDVYMHLASYANLLKYSGGTLILL